MSRSTLRRQPPVPRATVAAIALEAGLVLAAISGVVRFPVHAVILAVGDKGAHVLAGFVLVLPPLLLLLRSRRAWLLAAVLSLSILPVAWESPVLGLSLIYDSSDVLANFVGAILAVTASVAVHWVRLPANPQITAVRGARRTAPALVGLILLLSSFAVVAAFDGSVALPNRATRSFPETGFLDVVEGQTVNWSWTSGYINYWWEEESRGTFAGGDTWADAGCWYVDVPASVRIVWANTADPPTGDTFVNYTVDVVNGTGGPTADCPALSIAMPPPRPPGPESWQVAALVLIIVAAVAVPTGLWWRRRRTVRTPPAPPAQPPSP